jgi:hypothetical protein
MTDPAVRLEQCDPEPFDEFTGPMPLSAIDTVRAIQGDPPVVRLPSDALRAYRTQTAGGRERKILSAAEPAQPPAHPERFDRPAGGFRGLGWGLVLSAVVWALIFAAGWWARGVLQ